MKERPMLMSAPMVRAILGGSKTQTRIILNESKTFRSMRPYVNPRWEDCRWNCETPNGMHITVGMSCPEIAEQYCPYGRPGDRLWVRESGSIATDKSAFMYADHGGCIAPTAPEGSINWCREWKSCPSIHMPRWASRILLEIVSVRVERLQSISVSDAIAEGYDGSNPSPIDPSIKWYANLWETINGPDSWAANPWVWVVEFKVIKP